MFLTFYLKSDLTFFLAFIRSATMSGILFGMYSGPCVAQSIRSWHRRSRQQRGGGGEGEGVAPLLKSRDPHLAGGKKHKQLNYNLILDYLHRSIQRLQQKAAIYGNGSRPIITISRGINIHRSQPWLRVPSGYQGL